MAHKVTESPVTNKVVNVVFSHFVQTHLEQHVDRSETGQRHMINLLMVGLQDELTEGTVAVSVNLQKHSKADSFRSEKKKKKKQHRTYHSYPCLDVTVS